MSGFKRGQLVNVPCEIQPGAFPDERLVMIHTDKGDISGFVKAEYLTNPHGPSGSVRGTVVEVARDAVKVRVPGSFFTSALGVASVSPGWASEHLTTAVAA
jgi:hypothetical protein